MKFPQMRHMYYYVPPCPRCQSRRTGRYVRKPFTGAGYMQRESLKAGELIRFLPSEPKKNAYCEACGYEWPCYIRLKWLTTDEMHEEQKARNTAPRYEAFVAETSSVQPSFWERILNRRMQETNLSYTAGTYTPEVDDDDVEIIDSRPRTTIEILYADEELIKKVKEVMR